MAGFVYQSYTYHCLAESNSEIQIALFILRPQVAPGSGAHPGKEAVPILECCYRPESICHHRSYLYAPSIITKTPRILTVTLLDWYTLRAVGQDDFEDVKVPEAPRKVAGPK